MTNPADSKAFSIQATFMNPNTPIGTAKGIFPGRVVWVHDSASTDENMTNTATDYWFDNTNQHVVDGMLNAAIKNLSEDTNIYNAWQNIFVFFNKSHQRGIKGYTKGEKIYIKINLTTSCCGGWKNETEKSSWLDHMDATPQLCHALLDQLIHIIGVQQSDIYLGDPFRRFHDVYWDILHSDFPDVHYMDGDGLNGREQTSLTSDDLLRFSDEKETSRLPQEYVNATYFINMACLKTHNEGGITLTAKNHQGSIIEAGDLPQAQSAQFMHYALPANDIGHKKYRHLVDYMAHEHLGGKTLIYLVDGIWAGFNWEGIVEKWNMEPFNGDYPSSLFVSLDPVALESVCYDFLLEEYKNRPEQDQYPYIDGTDDYLLQAADEAYWPSGIIYDPEQDGSKISSLGVHEHWNNASDKQYSRNLGIGDGIELYQAVSDYNFEFTHNFSRKNKDFFKIYPQPADNELYIKLINQPNMYRSVRIITIQGNLILNRPVPGNTDIIKIDISGLPKGNYILQIKSENDEYINSKISVR